jgi:hypothetical protein
MSCREVDDLTVCIDVDAARYLASRVGGTGFVMI